MDGSILQDQVRQRSVRRARDAAIIEAWLEGNRAEDLARQYGLSPARVHQIVPARIHSRERRRRAEARRLADEHRVLLWSQANPGVGLEAASQELKLPEGYVADLLHVRLCLHQYPATVRAAPPRVVRPARPRWSHDQLIGWVRDYFTQTCGPWSLAGLDAWLQQHDDAPSVRLIRTRVGRWPVLVRQCAGHQQ